MEEISSQKSRLYQNSSLRFCKKRRLVDYWPGDEVVGALAIT